MIILIECFGACLLFGCFIIGSLLIKKNAWLNDYPPDAVRVFLEKDPGFKRREKNRRSAFLSRRSLPPA